MLICHCHALSDKDFKEAARRNDETQCCQGQEQSQESPHCRLKKVYRAASGGRVPQCNGCYPSVLKLIG